MNKDDLWLMGLLLSLSSEPKNEEKKEKETSGITPTIVITFGDEK